MVKTMWDNVQQEEIDQKLPFYVVCGELSTSNVACNARRMLSQVLLVFHFLRESSSWIW